MDEAPKILRPKSVLYIILAVAKMLFVAGLVLLCLPPPPKRTLCFIAMGAAVASFAYGVLAKTNYQLALEDLRRDYPIVLLAKRTEYEYDDAKAEMTSQARRDDLYNSANTKRYVAEGMVVAGAASIGIAVWLFMRSGNEQTTSKSAIRVVPMSSGISIMGSY